MPARRAAAVTIAAVAMALLPASTAGARAHLAGFTAFDQRLLADINAERADHGLAPLQLSRQLQPVAANWAQRMASVQRAYDNPHFGRAMNAACPDWRHIGETVGRAGESTADDLFAAYLKDSSARQAFLSRKFRVVGISTVATDYDGVHEAWNAIEFADRCSG